ncbi:MAG: class I SAM-dependent methyltransferase [Myxococcales bacterium]|nr:class I SAM-dependent methyltransferase [Myxococcales bacterium]MCB9644849.1 class I SAM-dependent methyltransferase [Myxococcales bacterium]
MSEASSMPLIENKPAVPKEFNKIARRYDLATFLNQGYASDLRLSVERMGLQGDEKVLDLCCGTGKSTRPCLEALPKGHVIGVDFSEGMLEMAKANLSEKFGERVEFQLQDAMNLDFPEASFDAIFMAYGIRNMSDPEACLRQLYRLLKPGGQICFHEYSLADRWYARPYWLVLGYGFVVPFCTVLTGTSRIFRYLIKSVDRFLRPSAFLKALDAAGFVRTTAQPLRSWRAPILHTFRAYKPEA